MKKNILLDKDKNWPDYYSVADISEQDLLVDDFGQSEEDSNNALSNKCIGKQWVLKHGLLMKISLFVHLLTHCA